MIVVDASLAAKWILWEGDSPAALGLLAANRVALCGPDLLFVEVASAIVRRANENKALAADALLALEKWTVVWSGHAVRTHRVTQARLFAAGRLALELGHQICDCVYLALAMEIGAELATCDVKFAGKARRIWPDIRLLTDYDT